MSNEHRISTDGRRSRVAAIALAAALPLTLLAGCGGGSPDTLPTETVAARPLRLQVDGDGELKAVRSVPLLVPGSQWQQRQVVWIKPDGSRVEAGEVVARFSAARNELDLEKALLDLQRNALAKAGKQDELAATHGRVGVDLAQVGTERAIAERYADADLAMLSRNEILDAIQDSHFLGIKQGVLEWKQDQATDRGAAELAVLEAQKATFAMNADGRRKDLEALELRAPNAGVLVLSADWGGDKPKVGAGVWAGREFATLPDAGALEVEIRLPQIAAQGVAVGQTVELHPAGRPDQAVRSTLGWVAASAQQRGRDNPVKFVSMKAAVPAEVANAHGWVPGQAFRARILLTDDTPSLSVANIALRSEGEQHQVLVARGGRFEPRTIELGARGPARSQVLAGLDEGDRVLLLPAAAATSATTTAAPSVGPSRSAP